MKKIICYKDGVRWHSLLMIIFCVLEDRKIDKLLPLLQPLINATLGESTEVPSFPAPKFCLFINAYTGYRFPWTGTQCCCAYVS